MNFFKRRGHKDAVESIDLPDLGIRLKIPGDRLWLEVYSSEIGENDEDSPAYLERIKAWQLRKGVTLSLPDGRELGIKSVHESDDESTGVLDDVETPRPEKPEQEILRWRFTVLPDGPQADVVEWRNPTRLLSLWLALTGFMSLLLVPFGIADGFEVLGIQTVAVLGWVSFLLGSAWALYKGSFETPVLESLCVVFLLVSPVVAAVLWEFPIRLFLGGVSAVDTEVWFLELIMNVAYFCMILIWPYSYLRKVRSALFVYRAVPSEPTLGQRVLARLCSVGDGRNAANLPDDSWRVSWRPGFREVELQDLEEDQMTGPASGIRIYGLDSEVEGALTEGRSLQVGPRSGWPLAQSLSIRNGDQVWTLYDLPAYALNMACSWCLVVVLVLSPCYYWWTASSESLGRRAWIQDFPWFPNVSMAIASGLVLCALMVGMKLGRKIALWLGSSVCLLLMLGFLVRIAWVLGVGFLNVDPLDWGVFFPKMHFVFVLFFAALLLAFWVTGSISTVRTLRTELSELGRSDVFWRRNEEDSDDP